jgi:type VI secretion system protein VasD
MISLSISIALSMLAGGCSSGPKAYAIKGDGDPVLNLDVGGKSLSVVVRIYQLRDAKEFSKLTFDSLADGRPENELLGPALLDKADVVIVPGGTYTSTEKLHEETRFVGIVAFFRRPDQFYWRQLVEADVVRSQGLTFRVQDCYVMVNGIKPFPIPGQPANARPECGAAYVAPVRQSARPATAGAQPQQYQQPQRYAQPQRPPQPQQYPQQQYPQQQYPQQQYPQQQYPQQQYPQQQYQQQQYPPQQSQQGAAPANSGQKSGWLPQGMPDMSVNANTPIAPANVRIGRGGVSSVTVGEQAPAYPPPAQPYYGQPYPAQPYQPQPYPAQTPYDAQRY